MRETMLLGLRLTESGVSEEDFSHRFGVSYFDIFQNQIADLVSKGLLQKIQKDGHMRIRLTKKGRLLGNQVFIQFVA